MNKQISAIGIALALGTMSTANAEILKIPQQSGWSGFAGIGVAYNDYSSNLIAGNTFSDLDNDVITSVDQSAPSESNIGGMPLFDIRYTFAEERGQLFLGTLIQDAVRLDFTQQFGYRQELSDKSIVSGAFVFSGMPAKYWEDAYLENERRRETDRKSSGVRFAWSHIGGTGFAVNYTYRKIDIDEDRNGESAVETGMITLEEQRLLQRDGKHHKVELNYNYFMSKQTILTPAFIYTNRDMDGEAIGGDGYAGQVTMTHFAAPYTFIVNGYYGVRNSDEENPIYDEKTDADEYGINATMFYSKIFGLEGWSGILSASYFESDSDVEFHSMDTKSVNAAMLYRF
ncbi:DUF2860 family protein [Echinimonas agarilytica]|uniref:DUF2860 domain-containing protein n=1 Tax=Echinimonas agarilytica TaxID=1215918 RepID=A0AA41W8L2_9GAMM|nr:DUF2860 family protein [Echinimonas agarilytica]MCM2680851.1 DUF2860 domain-containing protein [Echinimonas agarilytica]